MPYVYNVHFLFCRLRENMTGKLKRRNMHVNREKELGCCSLLMNVSNMKRR